MYFWRREWDSNSRYRAALRSAPVLNWPLKLVEMVRRMELVPVAANYSIPLKRPRSELISFWHKPYQLPTANLRLHSTLPALESCSLSAIEHMSGKQAKILSAGQIEELLFFADTTRYPERNRVMVLLSTKAGLRAAEIANLTWQMVLGPTGEVGTAIELRDRVAKMGSGRTIPLHPSLRATLSALPRTSSAASNFVIRSERGGPMTALSVVVWFKRAYDYLGFDGCSSHSGRRTFVTRAARLVHKTGGSLRDVQLLAGHRSIQTTQRYIDGDSDAQRRLVSLI
jgi:integrase